LLPEAGGRYVPGKEKPVIKEKAKSNRKQDREPYQGKRRRQTSLLEKKNTNAEEGI